MRLTIERITAFTAMMIVFFTAAVRGGGSSGTVFTYQGQLKLSGAPLNDLTDFEFTLWNAESGGAQVGSLVPKDAVEVKNGLFQVKLDFGANALSGVRWLAISIRNPTGEGTYTPVVPRQQITASPYSIQTRGIFVDESDNVGIGTSAPLDELHVRGDQATLRLEDDDDPLSFTSLNDAQPTQLRISKVNSAGQVLLDLNPVPADGKGAATVRFFRETNTTGPKAVQFLRGNFSSEASASVGVDGQNSYFQANGGNLGIGTSTPGAKLDVNGLAVFDDASFAQQVQFNGGARFQGGGLFVDGPNNAGAGVHSVAIYAINDGDCLRSINDGNGKAARFEGDVVMSGGNVGIGTSDPIRPLHVEGTANIMQVLSSNHAAGTWIELENTSPGGGRWALVSTGSANGEGPGKLLLRNITGGFTTMIIDHNNDVVVRGTLDIGYEIIRAEAADTIVVIASCPSGKRVIGGGCNMPNDSSLNASFPCSGGTEWCCVSDSDTNLDAYAICARVK